MEEPRVHHRRGLPSLLAGALGLLLVAVVLGTATSHAQAIHPPLVLRGDDAVAAAAHSGAGTAENPYVIRGLSISAAGGHGIQVENTRVHLRIDSVAIFSGGGAWDGIRLVNVRNVTVLDSTLEGDRTGIHVVDARDVTIQGTTVKTSRAGVILERSTAVTLSENRLSVNDRDVILRASEGNRFVRNNLTTATGQIGFQFEDAQSYRNEIGTTNVVNFLPVHWYVAQPGNPCPARIEDVHGELRGATNVAQVMLHGCQGTLVNGIRAKDGIKAGIHLIGTHNVTLSRLTVEGNDGTGVHLEGGGDVRIDNATVRANGLGLHLQSHWGALLADVTVESNRGEGIRATAGSHDATFRRVALLQNAGTGLAVLASRAPTLEEGRVALNRGIGILLEDSAGGALARNRIHDNAGAGVSLVRSNARIEDNHVHGQPQQIRFAASPDSDLRRNNLTLLAGQTGLHFDDAGSYANHVEPTNTANGVPLRWYHNLQGAPDAPVRLGPFLSNVTGATNVAQVMIHASRHVELVGVNATQGSAHGLMLHGSRHVTVSESNARTNARHGILLDGASHVRLHDVSSRENRDDGLHALGTDNLSAEASSLLLNGGRGASLDASPSATLRNLFVTGNKGAGLVLARAPLGASSIDGATVKDNAGGGILVQGANLSLVRGNVIEGNGADGLHLQSLPWAATILDNDLRNQTRNLRLTAIRNLDVSENRILIQPGQTGVHLDDETSWDNRLATTNVVNNVSLRWYNGAAGTLAAPLVLENVRVEIPGITNVAQILLRKAENVTLQGALAANGTHRGILILDSANVSLRATRAENNTLDGIQGRQTRDLFLHGTTGAHNKGHGMHLAQGDRARLDSVTLRDNHAVGLRAEGAGLHAIRSTLTGNGADGLHVSGDHRDGFTLTVSNLSGNKGNGLRADGARVHDVRDTTLSDNKGAGLVLAGGRFGAVEGNRLHGNALAGIRIEGATPGNVRWNLLQDNGESGIALVNAPRGGNLSENVVSNHTKGISFANTARWSGHANHVTLRHPAQVGFHFADEASYPNLLPATNRVNGTALQWHVDVDVLDLLDVRVEQRGITNVAQILLYNASRVLVDNATLANGTGHGLLLHKSADVRIVRATIANHTLDGVRALESPRASLADSTIRHNGGHGAHFLRSSAGLIERVLLANNTGLGAKFTGQHAGHEIADSRVLGNAQGGVELDSAVAPRIHRNEFRDNGPLGLSLHHLSGTPRVADNVLANHTRNVQIASTEYAEIHRNNVTLRPGDTGYHFSDEASYNNVIPPTNLVNGVPVRWYVGLTGTESAPVQLGNLDVQVKGVTNVAQIMLFRSSYVTLDGATANEGTHRGVELYHSSSIILRNVTATRNAEGIRLTSTQSSQLHNLSLHDNPKGAVLRDSRNNVLAGLNVIATDLGIVVEGRSEGNRIHATDASLVKTASVQDPSVNGLRGHNLVADAGLDRRALAGRQVRLDGATTTYRFETERITLQRWDFGDNTSEESAAATPLRPLHTYAQPGRYLANLTVHTADGGAWRDSMTVTVLPPLGAPLHLRALPGDRNVTLAWDPPASDGASPITKHRVWRGPDPGNLTLHAETGAQRLHLDTKDVKNGVPLVYAVSAVSADSEGPKSAPTTVIPGSGPTAPRNLAARAGNGTATLAWDAPESDGGRPVTAYRILRGPTVHDLSPVAEVDANHTAWTDTRVAKGHRYHYAVLALNPLGAGPRSALVSVTPAEVPDAPTGVRALPGDRAITLVWSHAPTGVQHRILRGESPTTLAPIADTAAREWRDATALSGVTYHYAVVAFNDAGESPPSAVVHASLSATDTLRPIFLATGPASDKVHDEPPREIWADWLDNVAVNPASVRLVVNGANLTQHANVTERGLRYAPATPFLPGTHLVRIDVADAAGNPAETTWTFEVADPARRAARFEHANLTLSATQIRLGEAVHVNATVRNAGAAAGTLTVRLLADNASADTRVITLAPGASGHVSFLHVPAAVGPVALAIGDLPPHRLDVLPPEDKTPGVPDGAMPIQTDGGEEEGEGKKKLLGVPGPGALLVLAAIGLGAAAWRRRAQ